MTNTVYTSSIQESADNPGAEAGDIDFATQTSHHKSPEMKRTLRKKRPVTYFDDDEVNTESLSADEPSTSKESTKSAKAPSRKKQKIIYIPAEDLEDDAFEDEDQNETASKKLPSEEHSKGSSRLKVVIGKKAAAKLNSKKNEVTVNYEEENILDYEDDTDVEDELPADKNVFGWKKKRWTMDPRKERNLSTHLPVLRMSQLQPLREIDFLFHMMPVRYIREEMIPALNDFAREQDPEWVDVTFEELIRILGLIYSMQVVKLAVRRMYWQAEDNGIFKGLNYGAIVARSRFEAVLRFIQFSSKRDNDEQILDLIDAVNKSFKESITAGYVLVEDESMVKSYHKNLKGKQKIKRKPRPIGNEFKNIADGQSQIVLHIELYEGKEYMQDKNYVSQFGATTATAIRLAEHWESSGRIVVADAWFGSCKTAIELLENHGLYSIMLVKNNHKNFPRAILDGDNLERGEWNSAETTQNGVKLLAVRFKDLKEKYFISTCSTSLPGPPRHTKYHGDVSRPMVAYEYLKYAATIDIHNHVRQGAQGFEDVWQTMNPHIRQFAGIMSFVLTNSYLAMRYFQDKSLLHTDFNMALSNAMVAYRETERMVHRHLPTAPLEEKEISTVSSEHTVKKFRAIRVKYQKKCYYCQHGRNVPARRNTSYYCAACGENFPLCSPLVRDCFSLHIQYGMPHKLRRGNK